MSVAAFMIWISAMEMSMFMEETQSNQINAQSKRRNKQEAL
jgi:hypothetical protein